MPAISVYVTKFLTNQYSTIIIIAQFSFRIQIQPKSLKTLWTNLKLLN